MALIASGGKRESHPPAYTGGLANASKMHCIGWPGRPAAEAPEVRPLATDFPSPNVKVLSDDPSDLKETGASSGSRPGHPPDGFSRRVRKSRTRAASPPLLPRQRAAVLAVRFSTRKCERGRGRRESIRAAGLCSSTGDQPFGGGIGAACPLSMASPGRSSCSSSIKISFSDRLTAADAWVVRANLLADCRDFFARRASAKGAWPIHGKPVDHGDQHVGAAKRGHREDAPAVFRFHQGRQARREDRKQRHKKPSTRFIRIHDVQQHVKRHTEQQGISRLTRQPPPGPRQH